MQLRPFRIEHYYARYEFSTRLHALDAATASRAPSPTCSRSSRMRTSGCSRSGSATPSRPARRSCARRSPRSTRPSRRTTSSSRRCAEEGIFVAYHALLEHGRPRRRRDAVLRVGAPGRALRRREVIEWRRFAATVGRIDLDALAGLVRPNTKLVYLNSPHNPTGTLMPRETFDRVVALCAERRAWLFCDEVYRELEHDPADPAAGGLRRSTSARSRSARSRRPTACRACASAGSPPATPRLRERHRRPQALHHDLRERPERAPQRARAPPSPDARRAQPRHRRSRTCRCSTLLRPARRPTSSGCARSRARSASRGCTASATSTSCCARVAAEVEVLLLPGSVYDEPEHVRVGFGRANMPEALERLDAFLERLVSGGRLLTDGEDSERPARGVRRHDQQTNAQHSATSPSSA